MFFELLNAVSLFNGNFLFEQMEFYNIEAINSYKNDK